MRASCPLCDRAIPRGDCDLAKGVVTCRACGEMLALRAGTGLVHDAKLYRPETLELHETIEGTDYLATIPPRRALAIPLLFFCAIWDGCLLLLLRDPLRMPFLSVIFVAFGVLINHQALVALFNVRTVRIGPRSLRYRSEPIPLGGMLDARIDEIESFGAIDVSRRGVTRFAVVVNRGGVPTKLDIVTGDFAEARYVAESLNDALDLARHGKASTVAYRG